MRSKSLKLALAAVLTGAVGFTAGAVMLVTPAGCTDCNVPVCPAVVASIQAEKNVDLPITYIERQGPSCPSDRPLCRGDDQSTTCTHTEFYGGESGSCWVYIEFADRPSEIVRFDFGEKQSCCPGNPIIGESTYYIPVSADAAIYSSHDAGNDGAVTIVIDGGADADDDAAAN